MRWAAVIPAEDAHQLAALRQMGGIDVCAKGDAVWLRGAALDDAIDLALRKLSGVQRFMLGEAGILTPLGARTPAGTLPTGTWIPLPQYVVPQAPTAALPAGRPQPVRLGLARASCELSANVLVTSMDTWLSYACQAPQIRLAMLTFAVSADRLVIIRGRPLPPIQGMLMVEDGGIVLPCGFRLTPQVGADVARAAMAVASGDLVILDPDGTAQVIAHECFVAAFRSAVRLTAQELGHG